MAPQYRHEWKHVLNIGDLLILRQRLRAIMESDPHAIDGKYQIRSLYFDNLDDKALREKIDGVNMREKFRIRLYNCDPSVIHLEKKSKRNGLGTKYSASLTAEEAQKITSLKTPLQTAILAGIMLCDEVYKDKQNKIAMEAGQIDPDVILESNEIERHTLDMIEKIGKVL